LLGQIDVIAGDMYGGTTSHLIIPQSIEAACE
jgi:hypothetical protein